MTVVAITMAILAVALVLWLVLQSTQSQRKSDALESQMSELRRDLQTIATAQAQSTGQIATIAQSVSLRLESVTKALQDGVSSSAQIATQGQTAIATELKNTREQMGQIQKQLGEFQELSRNVSSATKSLEDILGGAKTRGILGEVTLERLLEDCLPAFAIRGAAPLLLGRMRRRGDFSARQETDVHRFQISAGCFPAHRHRWR